MQVMRSSGILDIFRRQSQQDLLMHIGCVMREKEDSFKSDSKIFCLNSWKKGVVVIEMRRTETTGF